MRKLFLILFGLSVLTVNAQDSTLSITGFVDGYYSYDFDKPANNEKSPFLYNHTRHNELSLNLALVQLNHQAEKTRGSIGLMAGSYAQYNLAHEQPLMRHVFEAYGGVRLARDLWLDMGIFGSHLGFESAISTDNLTLTRSLMAENSPYYLSGAKMTYTGVKDFEFLVVVSNGWQNISDNNDNKGIGTQVVYSPNDNLTFNYSTMFSNEMDSTTAYRFFNDFYVKASPREYLDFIAAIDYGIQDGSSWYAPAFIIRYQVDDKLAFGYRVERYVDPDGIIIANDFDVIGNSLNIDIIPTENSMLRVEFKTYESRENIFGDDGNNFAITTSLAVNFK